MSLAVFHVNAFTAKPFAGNPAAVCPLVEWLDDDLLRAVSAENNLSETAFFVPREDYYELRWFTPRCEVKLCGHATLASAFVLMHILEPGRSSVRFETRFSGPLTVVRDGALFAMDFPALAPWACAKPPLALIEGLGKLPAAVMQIEDNYFASYEREEDIQRIRPDFRLLEKLHPAGVAITAPGDDSDFVSRYFAPSYGVPEDPVTGSTHCSLAPYWAQRLGKTKLHARQVSERGGELWCEVQRERVIIEGNAVLTLQGEMLI
ncbi:MAG: PhzF family phenazine biosynthesis protein [Candidatus Sulfotelmatobacter sp.]|jgi:predicted PhzF superfamily epimerase YddE/YHI9